MKDIRGIATSYYPLYANKNWTINFSINIRGDMNNLKDGF